MAVEVAVVLGGGVFLAIAVMLLARRVAPTGGFLADCGAATAVCDVLGPGSAVLIAFERTSFVLGSRPLPVVVAIAGSHAG